MRERDLILVGVGAAVVAAVVITYVLPGLVKKTANAVNPLNPDNVFASGVNAVGATVASDPYWTLGGWLYEVTHPARVRGDATVPSSATPPYVPQSVLELPGVILP